VDQLAEERICGEAGLMVGMALVFALLVRHLCLLYAMTSFLHICDVRFKLSKQVVYNSELQNEPLERCGGIGGGMGGIGIMLFGGIGGCGA